MLLLRLFDALKVFLDVALEHIPIFAGELGIAADRCVGSLSLAAGVGVVDEAPFKDRLDHVAQGMVHYAITVGRSTDQAPFRVEYEEVMIRPVPVGAVPKALLDGEKLFFKVEVKKGGAGLEPLAELRFARRAEEVFE